MPGLLIPVAARARGPAARSLSMAISTTLASAGRPVVTLGAIRTGAALWRAVSALGTVRAVPTLRAWRAGALGRAALALGFLGAPLFEGRLALGSLGAGLFQGGAGACHARSAQRGAAAGGGLVALGGFLEFERGHVLAAEGKPPGQPHIGPCGGRPVGKPPRRGSSGRGAQRRWRYSSTQTSIWPLRCN